MNTVISDVKWFDRNKVPCHAVRLTYDRVAAFAKANVPMFGFLAEYPGNSQMPGNLKDATGTSIQFSFGDWFVRPIGGTPAVVNSYNFKHQYI